MKIKHFVSGIIFVLIAIGVFYKIYERQFVIDLTSTFNSGIQSELQLLSEKTPLDKTATEKFDLYGSMNVKTKPEEAATIPGSLIQASNIVIDKTNEYSQQLSDNLTQVQKLRKRTNLLFGKVKSLSNDLLTTAEIFYSDEITSEKKSKAFSEAFNVIIQQIQDYGLSLQHAALISKSGTNPVDISRLEKYSRSDWTYNDKDQIQSFYPYTYEIIQRYKNYLGGYYLLYKDIVKQNYESATYKYSKFADSYTDLSVDWSRMGSDNAQKDVENTKTTLGQALKMVELFYSFNNQKLGRYPFTKEAMFVINDPLLCNLYVVKTGLYQSIKYEYPKANKFSDLLTNLSSIAPKTEGLDRLFDKSTLNYSSDEKEMTFICKDKQLNRDYTFVISK
jgi:hypothetical protein